VITFTLTEFKDRNNMVNAEFLTKTKTVAEYFRISNEFVQK